MRSVHIGHEIIHTHAHLLNGIHIGGLYCAELEGLCVGGWVGGQVGKERESVLHRAAAAPLVDTSEVARVE